jgi:hypothetical protein
MHPPHLMVMHGALQQPVLHRRPDNRCLPNLLCACMQDEERLWGELIDKYEDVDAPWRGDSVSTSIRMPQQTLYSSPVQGLCEHQCACPHNAGDIVGRAYGNRGNARTRQGKMDAALIDYNRAIDICPWSVDPVLNRHAICSLCPPARCRPAASLDATQGMQGK